MSIKVCAQSPVLRLVVLLMVFALTSAGCASKMASNPALEEARSAFQTAQANPEVVRSAPLELKKAEVELKTAQQLFEDEAAAADVEHHAYLAKKNVVLAQEAAKQQIAKDTFAQASEERNKVLLEARSADLALARKQAEAGKEAAAKTQEELKAAQEKAEQMAREMAELQAVKAERGMVVTLGAVLFGFDKAELKPTGIEAADKLAAFMRKYPERRVMIEGFTDSIGSEQYNLELSERRANAVRSALLNRGIDANRIEIRGYGKAFPVATNDTADGRQLNRRVEVIISDETGQVPPRTR